MQKKERIPVGILGATGIVGQKFVELLQNHPWFEIAHLGGSERTIGKKYGEIVNWQIENSLDKKISDLMIEPCIPTFKAPIVFSGLDSSVAGEIEEKFANEGYIVISNSKNHRMKENVPLLIPEINGEHLEILSFQNFLKNGKIITNPNCSVVGLSMALKPLDLLSPIQSINVVTLQAISGAGYPGVSSVDIIDNVIPHIEGEEEKIESEPLKIFGKYDHQLLIPHPMTISAQCNRIPTIHGHLACVTVKFEDNLSEEAILNAWTLFSPLKNLNLPSAPASPLCYFNNPLFPQPRKHRNLEKGMQVSMGKLRKVSDKEWKFVILSHNTVRGAAGCAILNAELYVQKNINC